MRVLVLTRHCETVTRKQKQDSVMRGRLVARTVRFRGRSRMDSEEQIELLRAAKSKSLETLEKVYGRDNIRIITKPSEDEIIQNYLSMKGVPTKDLKLRRSMARYLLRLVEKDRYMMKRSWGTMGQCLEPIMSEYLETRLREIVTELQEK